MASDGNATNESVVRGMCVLGGFGACVVLIWLHRVLTNVIFGAGLLKGQSRLPNVGHYVQLSRGVVHYVFMDGHTTSGRSAASGTYGSVGAGRIAADSDDWTPSRSGSRTPLLGVDSDSTTHTRDEYPGGNIGQELHFGGVRNELVVLLHGFAGSNDLFISQERSNYASWLNEHGYAVLAFDMYGHGHSDGPDTAYSVELFCEQLAELCLVFGITEPFDLLGFSMGGSVAVVFAHRFPHMVKRLILQAPHVIEAPLRPSLQLALRVPFFREVLSIFIIPFIGECRNNPASVRASFRLLLTRLKGGGRWSSPGFGGSTKSMLRDIDRRQEIPVYLLWGDKDTVVSVKQSRKLLLLAPSATLVTYPGADHMSFADGEEHSREFFRATLLEFLAREV